MNKRQKLRKALLCISFFLFPVTIFYFSPVIIIMGAYKGIVTGSLILFTTFLITAFFTGRAMCGWICPAGGLGEICFTINDNRTLKNRWIKYAVWFSWLTAIIILFVKAGGFRSYTPLYQTSGGISVMNIQSYIVFYFFVALIFILSLLVGKRSFCHHLCWIAPFMVTGRKISNILRLPSLRLEADKENCIDCGTCIRNCPMSLNVPELVKKDSMENTDCILCGICADICRKNVIRYTFRSPLKRTAI